MLLSYSVALGLVLACAPSAAWAQLGLPKQPSAAGAAASAVAASSTAPTEEVIAEDSPRSALEGFLRLAHAGKYAEAAKYLELPPGDEARGPRLAARLTAVLDRYAWAGRDTASAAPSGDTGDGLPRGMDEVGKVPGEEGALEPVRLVQHPQQPDAHWQFSRVTTQHIDDWYAELPHRWLMELAPEPLLRMGPANLVWAQWCALPLFLLVVWTLGALLGRLLRRVLKPWVDHSPAGWESALLVRLKGQLTFACRLLIARALLPALGLYTPAALFASRSIRALLLATFFWSMALSVDVAGQIFASSHWGEGQPAKRALFMFGSRVGKFFVGCLAIVALFSELGYPVASLIAGLGVGGIAVALAAQKSLENLIGAFAIAIDQPFREGDFVRVDGVLGNVEIIGMRSTRVRTQDRTVVSIPNGKLADMRLETFAERDRIRWAFTFGVTYQTSQAQMRTILAETEQLLRKHPKVWPVDATVRFKEFGESGLVLDVAAWFDLRDFDAFTLIRQDLLLEFMAVVERAGAQFALPTRTLTLAVEDSKRQTPAGDAPSAVR
jgi:MscS family membrane protein